MSRIEQASRTFRQKGQPYVIDSLRGVGSEQIHMLSTKSRVRAPQMMHTKTLSYCSVVTDDRTMLFDVCLRQRKQLHNSTPTNTIKQEIKK